MKKALLFLAIIASVFCLSANKLINSSLLVVLDPDLPETPYDYSVEIPDHVINDVGPFGSVDPDDVLEIDDNLATLGRVLFYDEVLSAGQNIACATCHLQTKSFADEFIFSEGVNGDTRRNSLQLNDLAWTNKEGFFWDMRKLDLAEIIEIPLTDGNELGVTDFQEVADRMLTSNYYPDLFDAAYGDAVDITQEKVVDALVHFISSITSFNSKFDNVMKGEETFTDQEFRGFEHFNGVCRECHFSATDYDSWGGSTVPVFELFPFLFSNGSPITEDLGLGEFYPGMDHLFKIPTLKNIELTGPYMHDGRFETLEEVLQHYSEDAVDDGWGFVPPGGFGLSSEEQADIVAFLKTMTDETMESEIKWSDPFQPTLNTLPVDLESLQVNVYPNPATDFITIELENENRHMIKAALVSSTGQTINKYSTHGSQLTANLSNVPAGLYFVKVNIGDQYKTKELLVRK